MAKSVVAFSLNEFDPNYTRVLIGYADFGFTNFTDLGTLEVITGFANFSNSEVENLGNLTTIGGDAYFSESAIKDLGNLTTIGGDAYFENIAITKEEMLVDLFSPNEDLTKGNSLIASMHMNKGVLRHFSEFELRKETVQGKPFQYIIDKYELKNKQRTLVLIDVEGFEKDIIESIDFKSYKPDYLIFEHAHLTYDIHREINSSLGKLGYKIYLDKMDTLAILIRK